MSSNSISNPSMDTQHRNKPNESTTIGRHEDQSMPHGLLGGNSIASSMDADPLSLDNSLEDARLLAVGTNNDDVISNCNPNNSLLADLYTMNNSIKYSPVPASGMPDTPSNISAENALANMSMQRFEDYDLYDDINVPSMNQLMNQQMMQTQENHMNTMGPVSNNAHNNVYGGVYSLNNEEQQGQCHSDPESDDGHEGAGPPAGQVEAVGRWTAAEHDRFVHGLKLHGRVSGCGLCP